MTTVNSDNDIITLSVGDNSTSNSFATITEYIPTSTDFKSGVVLERDWVSRKILAVTDYCIYANTNGDEVLEVTAPTMNRLWQTFEWAPLSRGDSIELSYKAIKHITENANIYVIREVHLFGVNLSEDPLAGLSFNERCRKLMPSLLHIKSFKAKV